MAQKQSKLEKEDSKKSKETEEQPAKEAEKE